MGLIDKIKKDVKNSGANKGKIMFFKEGSKARVRFLQDMDDGYEFTFHDSYEKGVNVLCQEHLGYNCEYCDDDELRTRTMYCWSVWDYEAQDVRLFLFAVNNCSPIGALMAMYETYGTLTDRDFVISVTGKMQNKTFSVVPMDKEKFRNSKAKPFSEEKVLDILDKAYPDENRDEDEEEEEEVKPTKKSSQKTKSSKPAKSTKSKKEEVEEDEEWEDDSEEEIMDYSGMSAKELYKLCKSRDIEVEPKKPDKYYIRLLEEYDEAQNDWGEDDDEEEDWE